MCRRCKKYPNNVEVILLRGDKNYLKSIGAEMPYKIEQDDIELYGYKNDKYLPVAVLVDSSGNIHNINCTEINNINKTKNYYYLIKSFFENI